MGKALLKLPSGNNMSLTIGIKLNVVDGVIEFSGGWVKPTYGRTKTQTGKAKVVKRAKEDSKKLECEKSDDIIV